MHFEPDEFDPREEAGDDTVEPGATRQLFFAEADDIRRRRQRAHPHRTHDKRRAEALASAFTAALHFTYRLLSALR
jgi:hypothetical protein